MRATPRVASRHAQQPRCHYATALRLRDYVGCDTPRHVRCYSGSHDIMSIDLCATRCEAFTKKDARRCDYCLYFAPHTLLRHVERATLLPRFRFAAIDAIMPVICCQRCYGMHTSSSARSAPLRTAARCARAQYALPRACCYYAYAAAATLLDCCRPRFATLIATRCLLRASAVSRR